MEQRTLVRLEVTKRGPRCGVRKGIYFIKTPAELLIFMRATEDFCAQDAERGNFYRTSYSIRPFGVEVPVRFVPVREHTIIGYNDK